MLLNSRWAALVAPDPDVDDVIAVNRFCYKRQSALSLGLPFRPLQMRYLGWIPNPQCTESARGHARAECGHGSISARTGLEEELPPAEVQCHRSLTATDGCVRPFCDLDCSDSTMSVTLRSLHCYSGHARSPHKSTWHWQQQPGT